ncbi:fimbrial protein [Scandinavium sp. NPDC088450]|uniref:fimbrial protein n=1 Tax=Scandinavium sp. NPDC088450 TaxID=3364514 RepID=UPI00384D109B
MRTRPDHTTLIAAVIGCCLLTFSTPGLASREVWIAGGRVAFHGGVVNAACTVDTASAHQTVQMGQVRKEAFHSIGDWQVPTDFQIQLDDCSTNVSKNVSVMFTGLTDGKDPQVFQVSGTPNAAQGIGIGIFDSTGNLVVPNSTPLRSTVLLNGETVLHFSAKYRSTDRDVKPGIAQSEVWFNLLYQ